MANRRDTGVFKLENGCWAYRFTVKVDGVTITKRKTVDDSGQKFRTKTCAIKARAAALQEAITERKKKRPSYRHTIKEVFEEFCENGRNDRAYQTIRKQDSLWRNHLCERFVPTGECGGGRFAPCGRSMIAPAVGNEFCARRVP